VPSGAPSEKSTSTRSSTSAKPTPRFPSVTLDDAPPLTSARTNHTGPLPESSAHDTAWSPTPSPFQSPSITFTPIALSLGAVLSAHTGSGAAVVGATVGATVVGAAVVLVSTTVVAGATVVDVATTEVDDDDVVASEPDTFLESLHAVASRAKAANEAAATPARRLIDEVEWMRVNMTGPS
jgi:hypothetical protein